MMKKLLLLLLVAQISNILAAPRPASPQMIQAVEGENATVRCRFNRPENFTPTALHWTVNDTKDVLFSRHEGWIDPDAADAQYKLRTSLSLEDLARGILLVNISNVTPSDSGNYEGVVIGKLAGHDDPLELNCSVEFIVGKKEQTKRKDSGTPAPPAEGDPAAEKRNHVLGVLIPVAVVVLVVVWILVKRGVITEDVWKAALAYLIPVAGVVIWILVKLGVIPEDVWKTFLDGRIPLDVVVAVVGFLVKRVVIPADVWETALYYLIPVAGVVVRFLVKLGVIPISKKEGEPKTSEGDQQSAAEGLVGSEVNDNNNQIRSIKGSIKAE